MTGHDVSTHASRDVAGWVRDTAVLLLVAAIAETAVWLLGFVITPSVAFPEHHTTLRLNNLVYGAWVVLLWLLAFDARRGPTLAGQAATVATAALWLGGLISSVVGFELAWLSVSYVTSVVTTAAVVAAGAVAFEQLRASGGVFAEPPVRGPGWGLRLALMVTALAAASMVELPLDTGGELGLIDVLQQPSPIDLLLSAALRAAAGLGIAVAAGVLRPARLGAAVGLVLGLALTVRASSSALLASRTDITGGGFELHPMFLLLVLAVGVLIGLAALLWVNVEGDTEPTPKPTLDPEREW